MIPSFTFRSACVRLMIAVWAVGWCGADMARCDEESRNAPPAVCVLTANVRYGTADDGEHHWEKRKELLVETWRRTQADVVGTQEMLPFQADYLAQQFPEYQYVGQSRELDRSDGEQCGIFFRRDRFVLLQLGYFWLSETPDRPGSKSWDSSLPRMVTWVELYDRAHNAPWLCINTHLDHLGQEARRHSAELLRTFVQERASRMPVVVLGDFNCGPASPPYEALLAAQDDQESPVVDAYRVVHPQSEANEGTFHGFRGESTGERIDWILTGRTVQILESQIVHDHVEHRYPSDHYFVRARLNLFP